LADHASAFSDATDECLRLEEGVGRRVRKSRQKEAAEAADAGPRYPQCCVLTSLTVEGRNGTFRHGGVIGMKKSVSLVLFCGVLLCITLVQLLPQVDLPDAAFHSGTAPIVAKARFSPAPTLLKIGISVYSAIARQSFECNRQQSLLHTVLFAKFLPTLVCCIRC